MSLPSNVKLELAYIIQSKIALNLLWTDKMLVSSRLEALIFPALGLIINL
jgi:hypothetical protein